MRRGLIDRPTDDRTDGQTKGQLTNRCKDKYAGGGYTVRQTDTDTEIQTKTDRQNKDRGRQTDRHIDAQENR